MEIKFEYPIKGVTLTMSDMAQVDQYYEAACTAEYLTDNYPDLYDTLEKALSAGYEVRRRMQKYGLDESDAIFEVVREAEKAAYEELETELFRAGREAVEEFLGYSLPESEDKDVTARRVWEAHDSMDPESLLKFKQELRSAACSHPAKEG